MTPELYLETLKNAKQAYLLKRDIWSFGMVMYAMLNPNVISPYSKKIESTRVPFTKEVFQDILKKCCTPAHESKYENLRVSQWWQLEVAFKLCSNFMPNERPTTDQLINILAKKPENQLILKSLAVSQSTALGNSDKQFASLNIKKSMAHSVQGPANDGTNCCSFLGLGICDKMLCEAVNCRVVNWDRILQISEDMIINLPLLLHGSRDVTLNYDISEAHDILKSKNLLNFSYELSEEFVDGQKVFSDGGRQSLIESLCEKAANKESSTLVGLYTCSPYTFVLCIQEQSFFFWWTHTVLEAI